MDCCGYGQTKLAGHGQTKLAGHGQTKLAGHAQNKLAGHGQTKLAGHGQTKLAGQAPTCDNNTDKHLIKAQLWHHKEGPVDKRESELERKRERLRGSERGGKGERDKEEERGID